MLSNSYIQKRVANTDAKACFLCYKPTTSVMVSEAPGVDYFFACDTHLSDPGFAVVEQACQTAIAEREQKIRELEAIRTQWEEVQKKKNKGQRDVEPKEKIERPQPPAIKPIYELQRAVFNLRVAIKRRAAQERKTRAMLDSPGLFPEAPKHKPL